MVCHVPGHGYEVGAGLVYLLYEKLIAVPVDSPVEIRQMDDAEAVELPGKTAGGDGIIDCAKQNRFLSGRESPVSD